MRKDGGFEEGKETGLQHYAWLAVGVAVWLVTAGVASAQIAFNPVVNIVTGDVPRAVAIGDLNGDGKPDLVVANQNSGDVSVLLGNGDGTFLSPTNFALGASLISVAIGDLNGNGKLDLAVASRDDVSGTPDVVSVLLGKGDGTFFPATNFATADAQISVAIGDLNGDLKLDLAVANEGPRNVSVLLGIGDGTFSSATNFALSSFPRSVAIGDLNGNGKLDLAVASRFPDRVSVLLGNGDGTFSSPTHFTAGIEPRSVAIGDLNGDLIPDLAVANGDGSTSTVDVVSVLLGTGTGTFSSAMNFPVGGALIHIAAGDRSVAIGDLNGDLIPDLAVANSDQNGSTVDVVSVLEGNGDGTFLSAINFTVGAEPQNVAISDLNGDGKLDLVTANNSSDDVSILLNEVPPEQAIQNQIDVLQDIVDSNPGTPLADKAEDAIAKLQTALDELNKEPPDNQAAVGNVEGAVGDLESAVNDGLLDLTQGTQLMDQLAGVARQLAADALDQAQVILPCVDPINNPNDTCLAQDALADGDALRASGLSGVFTDFKLAVNKYKDALAKAESVLS